MPVEIHVESHFDFVAPERYPEAMEAAMKRIAAQLAGELKREAPVDTARLADSFTFEIMDPFTARAGTNVHYAKHVWLGTAPGHKPPWGAIKDWADRKGIPPGPVYQKIIREGLPGNDYVDRAENTVRDMMTEIIEHFLKAKGVIA